MKRLLVVMVWLALSATVASAVDDTSVSSGDTGVVCEQQMGVSGRQQTTGSFGAVAEGNANNETESSEIDSDDADTWLSKHGRLLAWSAVAATATAVACWACYQWWLKPSWAAELEAERQRLAAAQQAVQQAATQCVAAQQQVNDADQRAATAHRVAQQEIAQRIAAQDLAAAAQLVAQTAVTAEQAARAEVGEATNQLAVLRTNVTAAERRVAQAAEEKTMLMQDVQAVREVAHAAEVRSNALTQQFAQAEAKFADMQNQVQKAEEAVKKVVDSGDKDAKDLLMASVVYGYLLDTQQHSIGDMKDVEKEYKAAENEFKQAIKHALATYTIEPGGNVRGIETLDALVRVKIRQFLWLDLGLDCAFWQLSPVQRNQRMNAGFTEFLRPADDEKGSSQKQAITLDVVDRELEVILQNVCLIRLLQYSNQARYAGASKLIEELEKKYGKGT